MAKTFGSRLFGGYRKREVDLAIWQQQQRQAASDEENRTLAEQVETLTLQVEDLQTRLRAALDETDALRRQMEADSAQQQARLQEVQDTCAAAALREAQQQREQALFDAEARVRDLFEALDRSGADSRTRFDSAMATLSSAVTPLREKAHAVENAVTEIRAAALSLPAAYNRLQDARATAQADMETALAYFRADGVEAEASQCSPDETETAAVFFDAENE